MLKHLRIADRLLNKISKRIRIWLEKNNGKILNLPPQYPPEFIDVKSLIKELTLEELCQAAEDYFARLNNWDYHLSKPLGAVEETSEVLTCFSQVLQGLQVVPGMTVLDFGAGSCWTSRLLSQLGCHVIALDVSASALKIGQELYVRQPIIGDNPSPQFLHFNGKKIALPDESVDRILCFDAFHHVPNPEHVLKELSRVIKEGGIAGFVEPGPNHSKFPQSQHEMRNFKVIENDINIQEIWGQAKSAGFTRIELAILNPQNFRVSVEEFDEFFTGRNIQHKYLQSTRNYMANRRIFFLYKGESILSDSRSRSGLLAELNIKIDQTRVEEGTPLLASVTVTNTGSAVWLPTTAERGAVNLGVHLLNESGRQIDYDYFRQPLSPSGDKAIQPNETLSFEMQVPSLPKGRYTLEFDLVSEGICWFSINGSQTRGFDIEVV